MESCARLFGKRKILQDLQIMPIQMPRAVYLIGSQAWDLQLLQQGISKVAHHDQTVNLLTAFEVAEEQYQDHV